MSDVIGHFTKEDVFTQMMQYCYHHGIRSSRLAAMFASTLLYSEMSAGDLTFCRFSIVCRTIAKGIKSINVRLLEILVTNFLSKACCQILSLILVQIVC